MEAIHLIKIGGAVISDPALRSDCLRDFSHVKGRKILVHGGGKVADFWLTKLGIEPQMIDGRRITDTDTMDVVTMTYAGLLNKQIVTELQKNGCAALGLSGADGNVIQSKKRVHSTIDYGWVGDVEQVNDDLLHALLQSELVPVLCPITHDVQGQLLNTNADTIVTEIAIALSGHYLVSLWLCMDLPGVLADVNNPTSLVKELTATLYQSLVETGAISSGMLPKIDNAYRALNAGVKQVYITNTSVLKDLDHPKGTLVCL